MFLLGSCLTTVSMPPQATLMQGRLVDVDTVANLGSMYKSPSDMHRP